MATSGSCFFWLRYSFLHDFNVMSSGAATLAVGLGVADDGVTLALDCQVTNYDIGKAPLSEAYD